jgi:DNA-binding CsgD family transcriptional regulator
MSRIRLDYERGQRRRSDATQPRAHIEQLLALGWTQAQISRRAGLAHRTIGAIITGCTKVSNNTARAILNVPLGPAPADSRDIDATGTTRRVQALIAIGYPATYLAGRFGLAESALGRIARGEMAHVRTTTADTVALDYRMLSRIPGPNQRARNDARRKGWHGPLAWDDDIDDPTALPDIDQHDDKRGRPAQIDEHRVVRLAREGLTNAQIAQRIGCHVRTVTRARGRVLTNDLKEAA